MRNFDKLVKARRASWGAVVRNNYGTLLAAAIGRSSLNIILLVEIKCLENGLSYVLTHGFDSVYMHKLT